MHLSVELRYPSSVAAAGTMLGDAEYWLRRAATTTTTAAVETADVTETAPGAFTVALRRTLPSGLLPAGLHGVVDDRLEIRQIEAWEAERHGVRPGTVSLEISGVPVRVAGTMTLTGDGDGCRHRYDGEVTASVPLFGAVIEEAVAKAVRAVLLAEEEAARAWLSAH